MLMKKGRGSSSRTDRRQASSPRRAIICKFSSSSSAAAVQQRVIVGRWWAGGGGGPGNRRSSSGGGFGCLSPPQSSSAGQGWQPVVMYLFYLTFPPGKAQRDIHIVISTACVSVNAQSGTSRAKVWVQPWPAVGEGRRRMSKIVKPGKSTLERVQGGVVRF